ncbi:hypothetical protein GLAREA_08675 [Glarea lozoyensis ATCC 20868]|uniref:Uncharacterized protein n=1 Tax=Glarea lozoyensis (strain ATCC 20868 / MF5171) TaxID=1116229 RepID=S3DDK1_GLAL2|nr:uncharacterized protein GLAREA_08675 [Glarea lozoyensis ATCC 20868]EPE36512.1 hypothetical protein GLAREA_08675 [Glarea lozoyensis ATCC 20868]
MREHEDTHLTNESKNLLALVCLPNSPRPASPTPYNHTLPFNKDYTIWHEQACRPFLLDLIRNRTLSEVKSLAALPDILEDEVHKELLRRPQELLASLDLLNDEDLEIIGRSSTSSSSSTNSQSSQVSDSDLNDVQQSIEIMLQDLNQSYEDFLVVEKGRVLYRFEGQSKIVELKIPVAKELYTEFRELTKLLIDAQQDTVELGFPDLGLMLNQYDKEFKEKVSSFLRATRRSSRDSPWKSLLSSKGNRAWRREYPAQIDFMRKTQKNISNALDLGESVRNLFFESAFKFMEVIVQKLAKEMDFEIQDQFHGNVLISRIFETR